jgi:hypothetical protein
MRVALYARVSTKSQQAGSPTSSRTGRDRHLGEDPARCHTVVTGLDGRPQRAQPLHGGPDLARVSAPTTPCRNVQVVDRPAVRRQGPRRRRALRRPARARDRAQRRRDIAGPSPGPIRAGAADNARGARAGHPRLPPPRGDQPVRRPRRRHRPGDQLTAPPTPIHRVPQVPQQDRQAGAGRPGRAPDRRQLRHPQETSSRTGWPPTPASTCTSCPPAPPGSTRWSAGSPS